MNLSALNAFLLLSVAAADMPGPQAHRISVGAGDEPTFADDAGAATLTEAGWCEKCEDDWDNKDNGCKDMKDEKKDNCNYSSSTDTKTSDDRKASTSTESSDDNCDIDEKKPSKSRGSKKYYFELKERDALCLDEDKEKYEYGQYDDVTKFSSCAKKCVDKGPSDILKKLQGYHWNCNTKKCRCLYDEGTLKKKYDFDEYKTDDRDGEGSVKKTREADYWNCAKLDKVKAARATDEAAVSRRGLRGVH